jgi:hypothetical protein
MAEVRVNTRQVRRDGFPPVCAACGAPATGYRRRWFTWTPARSLAFLPFGYHRYWKVTLDVPFCAADQTYFTRRWAPLLIVWLLAVGIGVGVYAYTDITRGVAASQGLRKIIIPAEIAVVVVLSLIGAGLKHRGIHVTDVRGENFTLAGVSDEFAAALDEPPTVTAVNG